MKILVLPVCLAAAAAFANPPAAPSTWESGHFSLVPRALQTSPHIDVMIVTEFSPAGRAAPQASPAHPIYYTGRDGGMTTVGEIIAGEEPPAAPELAHILVEALKVAGYLPADAMHPPAIYIHYRWGSFNRLPKLGKGMDDLDLANLLERAALVGGDRFALEMARAMSAGTMDFFENQSPRYNFLVQELRQNQYFLIATAYDYAAASQGIVLPLWQTKLSTSSRGITMDESLPQLVASAAPYLGHETDGPVRLNRAVVPKGEVTVGTPSVVEPLPSDRPNPSPAAPPTKP